MLVRHAAKQSHGQPTNATFFSMRLPLLLCSKTQATNTKILHALLAFVALSSRAKQGPLIIPGEDRRMCTAGFFNFRVTCDAYKEAKEIGKNMTLKNDMLPKVLLK